MSDYVHAPRRGRQASRRQPSDPESTARRREAQIRRAEERERMLEEARNLWITNPTAVVLDDYFRRMTAWEKHNLELLYRFAGQPNRDERVREAIRQELRQYEARHGPLPRSQTEWMTPGPDTYIPQIDVMPPGVERSRAVADMIRQVQSSVLQEDRTRQEARTQEDMTRQEEEEEPNEELLQNLPDCGICFLTLNNIDGPSATKSVGNNVLVVCPNNHLFHRECIYNWCNSSRQEAAKKCPTCRAYMLERGQSCGIFNVKPKLKIQDIRRFARLSGGFKIRKFKSKKRTHKIKKHKKHKKTNKHKSRKMRSKVKK